MDITTQHILAIAACLLVLGLCEALIEYVKRKYPRDESND